MMKCTYHLREQSVALDRDVQSRHALRVCARACARTLARSHARAGGYAYHYVLVIGIPRANWMGNEFRCGRARRAGDLTHHCDCAYV